MTVRKNVTIAFRVLDYKLYQLNLDTFSGKVNANFRKNGGSEQIYYSMNRDIEKMLSVTAEVYDAKQERYKSIDCLGKGMRSIYMLSLLETCEEDRDWNSDIIIVEDPEIFLHPKMQRVSGDILYRLSKSGQVIFSTHSPNLISNFNSRQIRQMDQGEDGYSMVYEKTDVSALLDDLGYSANDLMNVNFVFIVEGKQDKTRLPLLLKKYYSEIYDQDGELVRVAIITTNSCTNIKAYANLKYMNQIYLRDNFLMIRDGDGKDREELRHQLCKYYEDRNLEDIDRLPRVTEKNVLILKYYSFENYFLNPKIMVQLGIIKSEEQFYRIFLAKWKEYPEWTVICGNGQLRLAVLILMDKFSSATVFRYAEDFNPEGLLIAQKLKLRYGERLKLWKYQVDLYETYLSEVELSDRRMKKLEQVYIQELQEIKEVKLGIGSYEDLCYNITNREGV